MQPASGLLLIASPRLTDPNFSHSVVYLIEHGKHGSLGLIVNRPLDVPLDAIWDDAPLGLADHRVAAQGGPVSPTKGLLLHGAVDLPGSQRMSEHVSAGGELKSLTDRWPDGPDRFGPRLFLGHSGWGPGQLDGELAEGSWLVRHGDPAILLSQRPSQNLWRFLIDGDARPDQPSVN